MRLPPQVLALADRGPDWATFVDALPRTVDDLLGAWSLAVDGTPLHGECALLLPVRTADGVEAALKVGFVDEETRHEHLTLTTWDGRAAVRLLRADPARGALLLERAGPEALSGRPALEACEVVAELYATLHVPAPRRLVRLSSLVARRSDELAAVQDVVPAPRRLVQQAVALGRAFAADADTDGTTVHTDLHDGNVLASRRPDALLAPWLVIDPKGVSGDPHHEPAPLLWNRWEEVAAARDVRFAVRRRFHTVVDVAGLDEHRARDWVVVRMMHQVLWTLQDAQARGRALDADDRAWITRCVTIAKAVQD